MLELEGGFVSDWEITDWMDKPAPSRLAVVSINSILKALEGEIRDGNLKGAIIGFDAAIFLSQLKKQLEEMAQAPR